jgi:hypothetical protein
MEKITAELYNQHPERYLLVPGHLEGAPTCPYGNVQEWVGFDNVDRKYIRFTKSVFKKLVEEKKNGKIYQ